jgi:hypothetical protein
VVIRIKRQLQRLSLDRLLYRIGTCAKMAPRIQQQIRLKLHLEIALILRVMH